MPERLDRVKHLMSQVQWEADLPPPEVGETVVYIRTGESATVLQVHRDDPTEVHLLDSVVVEYIY